VLLKWHCMHLEEDWTWKKAMPFCSFCISDSKDYDTLILDSPTVALNGVCFSYISCLHKEHSYGVRLSYPPCQDSLDDFQQGVD
jgi:hypothetical protein